MIDPPKAPRVPEPTEVEEANGSPPRAWTMSFSPSELTLTSEGAPSRVVRHEDRFTAITRTKHLFILSSKSPLALKSPPDVGAKLDAWIGPPTREHLRLRIRKIVSQGLMTGGALVLWASISDGPNAPALFLGLPLLLVGGLSYVLVHRALFAAMAVVYLANVAALIAFIAAGASPWLVILVVLIAISASVHIREYRSFAGLPPTAPSR